jgi:hypothetical protein
MEMSLCFFYSCAPISHTDVYYTTFLLALLSGAVRKNARRAYINVRHAEESGQVITFVRCCVCVRESVHK